MSLKLTIVFLVLNNILASAKEQFNIYDGKFLEYF